MGWIKEKSKLNKKQLKEYNFLKLRLFADTGKVTFSIVEAIRLAKRV